MPDPDKPSPIPTLLPFVVIALLLALIYGGVMLFPMFKGYMVHQDCLATGRTSC
jgi:hypothetical protein